MSLWQQGPKWRLAILSDESLPAAIPERVNKGQAAGGVVLHFFNELGELLAYSSRPGEIFGAPVDLTAVRAELTGAKQVFVVAYDGDDGEMVAWLDLD